jgi:hypothetical protein
MHEDVYYYWQRKLREATCEQIAAQELGSFTEKRTETGLLPVGWAQVTAAAPTVEKTVIIEIGRICIKASESTDTEAHSGLPPPSYRPCRAHIKNAALEIAQCGAVAGDIVTEITPRRYFREVFVFLCFSVIQNMLRRRCKHRRISYFGLQFSYYLSGTALQVKISSTSQVLQ